MRKHPWTKLTFDAIGLGVAANSVIAMRLAKVARGGAQAQAECQKMHSEKILAASRAAYILASSATPDRAASRMLAMYRKKVNANLRRLKKGD
jgi:hypothetical protein